MERPPLPYADETEQLLAFSPDIAAATAAIRRGWDAREHRVRAATCLPLEAKGDPGAFTPPTVRWAELTAGAAGDGDDGPP